ncbi:hypothetical protein, partial [Klebsiella pneumoniae]|uniref:hypothetical protein n=1 Tax=Klebsiella pneumoniae TaxID=573 RepID=UPI001C6FB8E7
VGTYQNQRCERNSTHVLAVLKFLTSPNQFGLVLFIRFNFLFKNKRTTLINPSLSCSQPSV